MVAKTPVSLFVCFCFFLCIYLQYYDSFFYLLVLQGDSGGPLQCRRTSGDWYLAGITSWGESCGGVTPGVYTQVEHYVSWIIEQLL